MPDLIQEIRNAIIHDRTTCAGDYEEAVEYADRIIKAATQTDSQNTQDQLRPGPLLETVAPDSLIYVQGLFRCTECEFQLSKATLHTPSMQVGLSASNLEPEPCPNDGTMLVKMTWKEYAEGQQKGIKNMLEREASLQLRVKELERALQDFVVTTAQYAMKDKHLGELIHKAAELISGPMPAALRGDKVASELKDFNIPRTKGN